ncbi:MAG: hypothetical protein WD716_02155 [Fimbriimonadaceae bacterium]
MGWKELLKAEIDRIAPGTKDSLKDKLVKFVENTAGKGFSTVGDAIALVVEDGTVDQKDVLKVLAVIVKQFGGGFVDESWRKDLIDRLETNGQLTTNDLISVAGAWAAAHTKDPNFKQLFQQAAAGNLEEDDIKAALLRYVDQEVSKAASKALDQLLADEHTLFQVAAAVYSHLVFTRKIPDKSDLNSLNSTIEKAIGKVKGDGLYKIVLAMAKGDLEALARAIVKEFKLGISDEVIALALEGNVGAILKSEAEKALEKLLPSTSDSDRAALLDLAIKVVTGQLTFAGDPGLTGLVKPYREIYLRTKAVVFAASRASNGGVVTSLDPRAMPNVFSQTIIRTDTELKSLVPKNRIGAFAITLTAFASREFGMRVTDLLVPVVKIEGSHESSPATLNTAYGNVVETLSSQGRI